MLAVGDSVTTGSACKCTPFPQQYATLLTHARGVPTTVTNLGVNGLTAAGLLALVKDPKSAVRRALPNADIDLITIGANDFGDNYADITSASCRGPDRTDCVDDELAALRITMTQLIDEIHQVRSRRPTAILVSGYWNVFQDGQVAKDKFPTAGVQATKALTQRANTVLREVADADGATYVGLYTAFNGPAASGDITQLLAPDGDHPNARGHALIAQRLLAAGLPGLVRG